MLLPLILLACSNPRPVLSEKFQSPQDRLLVIRDTSDETQEMTWQEVSELDRALLDQALIRSRDSGPIALTARRDRDCDKEQIECFRRCWKRKPPYPYKRGGHDHHAFCENTCREAYDDCLKLNELHALEFTVMDDAIDWLRSHRQQLLVGTLVTVAGVTFIVVSAGAGVLILAPLVLITQSETSLDGEVSGG
ncbi:hypothetical protein F0U60_25270 [Archangium minus]|uniref:Lipoprotein n=1 Tax=Archangium minus TaxID=83450 RepID=A0ABY9WV85_9BACT|nr:hypothetical protein F0U60_25270 [Archangium minus]